jgi:hypothetical protein
MTFTRRDLGKIALASGPLCLRSVWGAGPNSKINGVQIGVQTYSFRQGIPKTEIIPDMVKIGLLSRNITRVSQMST